jgi:hypothetical protein
MMDEVKGCLVISGGGGGGRRRPSHGHSLYASSFVIFQHGHIKKKKHTYRNT